MADDDLKLLLVCLSPTQLYFSNLDVKSNVEETEISHFDGSSCDFTCFSCVGKILILIRDHALRPEAPALTWNFWMISRVGLWSHSSSLISGCCSRSEALGVLVCLFTLECFGSSNSSKLLNSGILKTHMQPHEHTHHTVSPICKYKTGPFTVCL